MVRQGVISRVGAKVGAMTLGAGSIFGAVNDLLNPLVAIADYVVMACAIMLLIMLAFLISSQLRSAIQGVNAPEGVKQFIQDYWFAPLFLNVIILASVVAGAAYWSKSTDEQAGVLANTFPSIRSWQQDMGVVQEKLDRIDANTYQAAIALESLNTKADNFKREVSDDPRKELANRGILWNKNNFIDAVEANDIETVGLFLDGKMAIAEGNVGTQISDLFSVSKFSGHKKTFEYMQTKGVDFLADFESLPTSPLDSALNGSYVNTDGVEWLLNNNEHSALKSYGYVMQAGWMLDNKQCLGGENYKLAEMLVEAGVPIDTGIKDVEDSLYAKVYRKYSEGSKSCEKYVDLFRPEISRALLVSSEKSVNADLASHFESKIQELNSDISYFNMLVNEPPLKSSDLVPANLGNGTDGSQTSEKLVKVSDVRKRIAELQLEVNKLQKEKSLLASK